ncbi:GPR endopeptidase, partial [Clostridioides difficile]|nr:GPR endopeptidase [Clostridioides difficile]
ISGVSLREWHRSDSHIKMTEVKILDEKGSKAMGKPIGTYITLEADELSMKDEDYHREVSEELANQIERLLSGKDYR